MKYIGILRIKKPTAAQAALEVRGYHNMSKLDRKIRRQAAKDKKKLAEKEMATKVALFDQIPDACLICEQAFDKTDKEMVSSWCVIVRNESQKVNLYCQGCWRKALNTVREIEEHIKGEADDN